MSDLFDNGQLSVLERQVDEWLVKFKSENPTIKSIDRSDGDEIRWYVRLGGEEKDFTTIWITMGQRTLRYETYVMPAPEENKEALYELVLRANETLVGVHFSIGVEDAIFLRGEIGLATLTEEELDRIIGTVFVTVERYFPALLHLAFASRFAN